MNRREVTRALPKFRIVLVAIFQSEFVLLSPPPALSDGVRREMTNEEEELGQRAFVLLATANSWQAGRWVAPLARGSSDSS